MMLSSRAFISISIYIALILGIYYSTISYLVHLWEGDYSYCYLIPFVTLYLIWEKRAELRNTPGRPSWLGLIPLCLGIVLFWLGELGGEYFSLYISLWLVIVGLCMMHLGWQKIKKIGFALVILLTMFPLPSFLYNKLSVKLQLISSWLGVAMIQLYGMSAYREGNVIDLGFTQLQVVEACSGLRYVIPLLVMGLLIAYFFKTRLWKRIVLVLSSVPLAVFVNSMRIALTAVLSEIWGPEAAEGFFHGFSGWFIFMFSLAVLLLEMWVLHKIRLSPKSQPATPESQEEQRKETQGEKVPKGPIALYPYVVTAIILLGATLILTQAVNFREKVPPVKSFADFPLKVGTWTGIREVMSPEIIRELDLSDYAMIDYRNLAGQTINFYVAYYESQRKGESIHSPATCLPGAGWLFNEEGEAKLPIAVDGEASMPVNRAYMQKLGQKELVYYWFPQRGRILTNAYQLKLFAFWDALTMQRTDGALVRIITPVYDSETVRQAESRMQEFIRLIVPVLAEYIPGKKVS